MKLHHSIGRNQKSIYVIATEAGQFVSRTGSAVQILRYLRRNGLAVPREMNGPQSSEYAVELLEADAPTKTPRTKAEKDLLNLALLADIAKEFERRGQKKKAKECWAAFDAAPVEEIVDRANALRKAKPYACSNCGRRYKTVEATLLHKMSCPQRLVLEHGTAK